MPAPIAPIRPGRLELGERPPAAGRELGEIGGDQRLGLVVPEVEVVDDEDVDPRHAEALQAVLIGAHDAVIAVVEAVLERQPARPAMPRSGVRRVDRRLEDAADLGREEHLVARLAVEEAADAVLALAAAVPRRRVVVADAAVPGRRERRLGVGVGHHREEIAERRAAEAELRQHDLERPSFLNLKGSIVSVPHL